MELMHSSSKLTMRGIAEIAEMSRAERKLTYKFLFLASDK